MKTLFIKIVRTIYLGITYVILYPFNILHICRCEVDFKTATQIMKFIWVCLYEVYVRQLSKITNNDFQELMKKSVE